MSGVKLVPTFLMSILLTLGLLIEIAHSENAGFDPLLVTFGRSAKSYEGDHDFRQVIRISVPDGEKEPFYFQVFDAQISGLHDELQGRANSKTRFSLYGADSTAVVVSDGPGKHREKITGQALQKITIGREKKYEDNWISLFEFEASEGQLDNGRRHFFVFVDGGTGNDGNVFDVGLSKKPNEMFQPQDAKLYTYLPTFRVPQGQDLTELTFETPDPLEELTIESFDAPESDINFNSQFQSRKLEASAQNRWSGEVVDLGEFENRPKSSITFSGGRENPNDASLFITDNVGNPIAIELPLKKNRINQRPIIGYWQTSPACREFEFNASATFDPDPIRSGSDLTYNWLFSDGEIKEGVIASRKFNDPGKYSVRLEVFENSGHVSNGSFRDISINVKGRPLSEFSSPEIVSQSAKFVLDASGSKISGDGFATAISSYIWDLGNGTTLTTEDPILEYSYPDSGDYEIKLTVLDDYKEPCNNGTSSRTISVNAPQIVDLGGDRSVIVGEVQTFDASKSRDPDGAISSYDWDFGDGQQGAGRTVRHAYHEAGQYKVTLRTTDNSGLKSHEIQKEITVDVMVRPNERPLADAGDGQTVNAGEPVQFSGLSSSDADGEIIKSIWDFGDGKGGDRFSMEHTYWEAGTYNASLTIQDNSGQPNDTAIDTIEIIVLDVPNKLPTALIIAPSEAIRHNAMVFDATASEDSDGTITTYEWDFGDGAHAKGPVVRHSYKEVGAFEVKLTVTDSAAAQPGQSSQLLTVNVSEHANLSPHANAGQDMSALTQKDVRFDGLASEDVDGSIVSYRWDFGDGHKGYGAEPIHSYQFAGDYSVTLTVTDNDPDQPRTSQDTVLVGVSDPDNQSPFADAGQNLSVSKGKIIQFDGTNSADDDGNIVSYHWDFGNGETSSAARPVFAYHDEGTYQVQLTVGDDNLVNPLTGSQTIEVEVRSPSRMGADQ